MVVENSLASIVAKILIFVDQLLETFVTVSVSYAGGSNDCDLGAYGGTITPCGQVLVDNLTDIIFYITKLGGQFLPALSPINNSPA